MTENAEDKPKGVTNSQMLTRMGIYAIILAVIWYFSSGRWDYWLGWVYIALDVLLALVAFAIVPLDEELADERTTLKQDVKSWDKPLVIIGNLFVPFGFLIAAGLDLRFGRAPYFDLWLVLLGLVIAILGRMLAIWSSAVNKFYARFVRIQTERGHHVIDTGPYRFIRHPGYAGILLNMIGAGFFINSLWGLIVSIILAVLLIVRTALEDKTLKEELEGYEEYTQRTRYRLLPGFW